MSRMGFVCVYARPNFVLELGAMAAAGAPILDQRPSNV
jgi:hypothetical protein